MKRMNWLDKLIFAAVLILLAVLLQSKPRAGEDTPVMVFDRSDQGLVARFFERLCDDPRIVSFLEATRPDLKGKLKDADSVFLMARSGEWKPYTGCWAELTKEEVGYEAILFFAEDGDFYILDKTKFRKGTGV